MATIIETENFIVEAADKPHLDREDGGHIKIMPKIKVLDRQELSPNLAIEIIRLSIIVGEAMKTVLTRNGVDIGRINYQDNGNWQVFSDAGPNFHIHLYGRAKSAKIQRYGQACHFPHKEEFPELYENLKPLNKKDIEDLNLEIFRLQKEEKFADSNWHL